MKTLDQIVTDLRAASNKARPDIDRLPNDRSGELFASIPELVLCASRCATALSLHIAAKCPFAPVHGGCHYPDCSSDCKGRQA